MSGFPKDQPELPTVVSYLAASADGEMYTAVGRSSAASIPLPKKNCVLMQKFGRTPAGAEHLIELPS